MIRPNTNRWPSSACALEEGAGCSRHRPEQQEGLLGAEAGTEPEEERGGVSPESLSLVLWAQSWERPPCSVSASARGSLREAQCLCAVGPQHSWNGCHLQLFTPAWGTGCHGTGRDVYRVLGLGLPSDCSFLPLPCLVCRAAEAPVKPQSLIPRLLCSNPPGAPVSPSMGTEAPSPPGLRSWEPPLDGSALPVGPG